MPKKLILKNHQSPGDLVMMLYAITSLHETYPGEYLTDVRVSVPDIFRPNPLITRLLDDDTEATKLSMEYPQINESNAKPYRFSTAFTAFLAEKLNRPITPANFAGILPISADEQGWFSAIHEKLGRDVPYWILNAGHKSDFTAKTWSFKRYQELVDRFPDVWFVQVGAKEHTHPELRGDNLIRLVGETDARQLIRLVYNSFGVISAVSFPMHLAYAVPAHPRFGRASRANITIAGGREPAHWEQGPNHQFIHTCGMLECCSAGGCWKSRVVPLNDGDKGKDGSLCVKPVQLDDGQWIPACMDMIEVDDVARVIDRYMRNLAYEPKK
jgi:ADP-heptose:LPS heptosyltransferase